LNSPLYSGNSFTTAPPNAGINTSGMANPEQQNNQVYQSMLGKKTGGMLGN